MKSSPQFQRLMRLKKFRGYIRELDVQPIVPIESWTFSLRSYVMIRASEVITGYQT